MKFLFTSKKIDLNLAKDFDNLELRRVGEFSLLINDPNTITETEDFVSVTNGYLRDYSFEELSHQKRSAIKYVFKNWPVEDHITGSFSTLILEKQSSNIVITSDLCNIYPLYYLAKDGEIFISNSIILIGRYSGAEEDKTGIFQRAVGPNFCNIGSRTILQNCKRLVPGEWITLNQRGKILERKFDNSLYQNIGNSTFTRKDIEEYWEQYKMEVELCTQGFKNANIALSGGIDSRVVLGAISRNIRINAQTFGHPDNYESKIASKLAKVANAQHTCFYDPEVYFPSVQVLESYTRQTEAVKLNSWLEILENISPKQKQPLFIGELCEGLPGRNIKTFSSSKFRHQNFFKFYIKKRDFDFTNSSLQIFDKWKNTKKQQILSWHDDNWFANLGMSNFKNEIIKYTQEDLNEIFDRIEAHNLPYAELYDELFSWYTYTRMELSKQVNICNEKFYAFSPGMSVQMLRRTSNIHPNNRLYYRFANKLFQTVHELKQFNKIPTSQIPIIPQNSSNILKIPVWGLRSKIDDFLVRRLMKSKDISKRYRLLQSINWVRVYQQKDMLENIKKYYAKNQLTESYFKTFYTLADKRKNMVSWPFANMDIISGASLNIELELIKNYPL